MSTRNFQDDFELRSLVLRERYLKDTQQWEGWRDCYHPDSSRTWIEIAWIAGEIDEFVTRSVDMTGRISSTHSIQPVDVKINTDRALIMSYGHITLRFTEQEREYDMISWGWWIHRAVRLESQQQHWLLTAMRFIYNRDSIVPVAPGPKSALDIELSPDARSSYRFLEWTLSRRGYTISKTLAGTDRPDGVKELRAQEDRWLAEGSCPPKA